MESPTRAVLRTAGGGGGGGVIRLLLGTWGITSKVLTVVPMKFSPQKSEPLVSISPKIVGKSIKIDSVVCFGITTFSTFSEKNYGDIWEQMVDYVNDFTPSPHDF